MQNRNASTIQPVDLYQGFGGFLYMGEWGIDVLGLVTETVPPSSVVDGLDGCAEDELVRAPQ